MKCDRKVSQGSFRIKNEQTNHKKMNQTHTHTERLKKQTPLPCDMLAHCFKPSKNVSLVIPLFHLIF